MHCRSDIEFNRTKNYFVLPGVFFVFVFVFFGAFFAATAHAQGQQNSQIPTPSASFTYDNIQYVVVDGAVYKIDGVSGDRQFFVKLYDTEYLQNNYTEIDGVIYRLVPDTGEKIPTRARFFDGFENASSLKDLIGLERGWTSLTLQSAGAPTVGEYVALRQKILRGETDFIDNRIEPSPLRPFVGNSSLRAFAPAATGPVPLTKASLESELLYFERGDDFWFSAMFYIESGTPTSLVDIEAGYILNGPGMRLMVSENMVPRLELKWGDKPTYRPNLGIAAKLPLGKWFKIDMHFFLSDDNSGVAKLWLDDELVISANGQTLPMPDTVLTRLQIGITANSPDENTLVYVDQVAFSKTAP